ncbi:hypothetical protein GCM10010326_12290 [Streptomyces xanthochromogenes]|uniref:HTH gntR-type domain-containing protein n=1 Tax=Streptomyces xanthochromogenes TaxID=67384 RepID=A0ABQ2ZNV4_9ACTN|nr:hypothetical protein GCM10010326_12290 [Streptomyces xanthochromogenes]
MLRPSLAAFERPITPPFRVRRGHATLGSERWSDARGAEVPEASPRGTYLIIAETLRSEIQAEQGGDTLPSEADLMDSHGVSRNTIRRALKVLEADGVVESAPGIGWRVVRGGDRRSLAERMTDVIKEDSLSVGDTYPSEAKLCERFGASRTAVRRVLAQMEGNGLLATVHGKGRTVRALPASLARP